MTFDATRAVCILVGFSNVATTPVFETWEFNGVAWSQVAVGGPPMTVGVEPTLVDVPGVGVVLFGAGAIGNHLWAWSGKRWTRQLTDVPGPSQWSGICVDEARQRVVKFGGAPSHPSTFEWALPSQLFEITGNPTSAKRAVNHPVTFSVAAQGVGLTYQWRRDGVGLVDGGPYAGTCSPNLVVTPTLADSGSYDCIVGCSNGYPTASAPATLTVFAALMTFDQALGPGSLRISVTSEFPGQAYFSAFSVDAANATAPGQGIWFGLHITIQDLINQYFAGGPPFVGLLNPTTRPSCSRSASYLPL
jgi:hypothetical protein